MFHQRAIFVPGHGRPESVRAVRFVPLTMTGGSAPPSSVEIWAGNIYGDLNRTMLASRSVSDGTEFTFPESERPVVLPERSLVVVIREPPERWEVEFDSVVEQGEGKTVSRLVTIDNFGTARESFDGGRQPAIEKRAGSQTLPVAARSAGSST